MIAFLKSSLPHSVKVRLGAVYSLFRPDPEINRFVAHNRKAWKGVSERKDAKAEILFDAFPVAGSIITASYFLNILADKLGAKFRPFSYKGISSPYSRKLYESFGADSEVITRLKDPSLLAERDRITDEIFPTLKTKQDVFDIQIHGLEIGIDIYESYLRFCGKPTVYIDEGLRGVIREAAELVLFWEKYISEHNVVAFVVSHVCYNHLNIPAKIAFRKKIPLYIPYPRGMYRLSKPFEIHAYFPKLREMFARLTEGEQKKAMEFAKGQLARRLSGEIGVDMPYSTKSAYARTKSTKRVLAENDRVKVLIASHCFYDNPYAFGDLLFIDFYEWISFLGKIAEETDYDWYLKMHPDPFPGTEETMKALLEKFPRIKMIPKETSHLQLVEEGLNFVMTAYGSVGHEYPALGVQVVNAGYNPRMAYDINHNPKTVQEYRDLLLNLKTAVKPIVLEELYELYYMYHYYIHADDFIFDSYADAMKAMGGYAGMSESGAYKYFLDQFSQRKDREIKKTISDFIDSGATYYFSKGIEPV